MNSSSSDRPVMISGMTSGAVVMPASSGAAAKAPKRASAVPASVPRITAPVALMTAIRSDNQAASRIWSFDKLPVPLERRRMRRIPDRDQPRVVERVDDQGEDRHIEEHQPGDEHRREKQAASHTLIGPPRARAALIALEND